MEIKYFRWTYQNHEGKEELEELNIVTREDSGIKSDTREDSRVKNDSKETTPYYKHYEVAKIILEIFIIIKWVAMLYN